MYDVRGWCKPSKIGCNRAVDVSHGGDGHAHGFHFVLRRVVIEATGQGEECEQG